MRLYILNRDGWVCQLCGERIDPTLPGGGKDPHPMSAQVHHLKERSIAGDDPRYLVAAHRICNQRAGEPTRSPQPRRVSSW